MNFLNLPGASLNNRIIDDVADDFIARNVPPSMVPSTRSIIHKSVPSIQLIDSIMLQHKKQCENGYLTDFSQLRQLRETALDTATRKTLERALNFKAQNNLSTTPLYPSTQTALYNHNQNPHGLTLRQPLPAMSRMGLANDFRVLDFCNPSVDLLENFSLNVCSRHMPVLKKDDDAPTSMQGNPSQKQSEKGHPTEFPKKLYEMLSELEAKPNGSDIASFLPNGRAFVVRKPKEFVEHVIPQYFRMTTYSSFRRQMKMYSFQHIKSGQGNGENDTYYHELFVRGQPHLYAGIKRTKVTKNMSKK